jgi:hypothetical protein
VAKTNDGVIDEQKYRVYAAERTAPVYYDARHRLNSLREVRAYVNGVVNDPWFKANHPRNRFEDVMVERVPQSRSATAYSIAKAIDMPVWAWHKLICLHEIAHLFNHHAHSYVCLTHPHKRGEEVHGRRWAKMYLRLIRRYLGRGAYWGVRKAFDRNEVRY